MIFYPIGIFVCVSLSRQPTQNTQFTYVRLLEYSYKMVFYILYFFYLRHEPSHNIIQLLRPFPKESMLTLLFLYDVVVNLESNMDYASISPAHD